MLEARNANARNHSILGSRSIFHTADKQVVKGRLADVEGRPRWGPFAITVSVLNHTLS